MAFTRVVPAGDIDKVLRATDQHLRNAMKVAVLEAAAVGAEIIAREAPVDTGRLKQSIIMRKRGVSGHPEIVAQAPYAGPVEVGSRPHWVPLTPLVRWVRRHWSSFNLPKRRPGGANMTPARTARAQAGRDRRIARRAAYDANIVQIARRIQLAIARRGTRPRYYMRRNLPRLGEILKTLVRESKMRALSSLGGIT